MKIRAVIVDLGGMLIVNKAKEVGENYGTITTELGQTKYRSDTLDQVFIPDGFDRVQSEIPEEQMIEFWNSGKHGKSSCNI